MKCKFAMNTCSAFIYNGEKLQLSRNSPFSNKGLKVILNFNSWANTSARELIGQHKPNYNSQSFDRRGNTAEQTNLQINSLLQFLALISLCMTPTAAQVKLWFLFLNLYFKCSENIPQRGLFLKIQCFVTLVL